MKEMETIKEFGYVRVGAAVPDLRVADVEYNRSVIQESMVMLENNSAMLAVFPELCMTGSTCGDLFFQDTLIQSAQNALSALLEQSRNLALVTVIGMPLLVGGCLLNVAVVFQSGVILAVIPKRGDRENGMAGGGRWFSWIEEETGETEITLCGQNVPFGRNFVFAARDNRACTFHVTIGDPVKHFLSIAREAECSGANLILNLGAQGESIGGVVRRQEDIKKISEKCILGYVYCGSGMSESTTNFVYAGQAALCEAGEILSENEPFTLESGAIWGDIDCLKLGNLRRRKSRKNFKKKEGKTLFFEVPKAPKTLLRTYSKTPFVPEEKQREKQCAEIYAMLSGGLARRMKHTGLQKIVLGISGGLDSTLAFLVAVDACRLLGKENSDILCLTMPGFGTTGHTYQNAIQLAQGFGAQLREISIRDACLLHFSDIGHDPAVLDTVYENAQARERTQILMDIANQEQGLVVGTGDLSESALGWCTYNGDHMSMYAVNGSIAKTLIPHLIRHKAEKIADPKVWEVLHSITRTPISPELLPPGEDGAMGQKTEDALGPYRLHDFFIYHFLSYGAPPQRLLYLAVKTFAGEFSEHEIKKWLTLFLQRFFSQQFKRNCAPDGPQIGPVSLSPGRFIMPSDAVSAAWIGELENDG